MESGILSSSTALLPPTPRTLELPRRPDFGSLGRPIVVQANLYPISSLSLGSMTLYRVSITPTSSARTNRRVFEAWCKETLVNETHFPVFDGKETVYSASPLPQDIVDQARFDLTLTPDTSGTLIARTFKLIVKLVKAIDLECIQKFVDDNQQESGSAIFNSTSSLESHEKALLALDVVARHRPTSFIPLGRSLFLEKGATPIAHGVELWNGFHQSMRVAQSQLLMNVNTTTAAFYQPGTAVEAIGKVLGPQRLRVPYPLTHDELLKTNHYFKGIKVLAEYRGSHKRQWKVATVTSTPAASTMFSLHSTERGLQHISVAEYFWKQYNIRLNFPHLPCLVVGDPAKKIYLPMEVCRIIPGQKYPYKLDELQTKDLIKHASLPPWLRSASIQKGYHNLFPDGDEYLKSFKIGIEPKMIETPARLLDPPSVRFLEAPAVLPYNGGWTMTTQKLVQPSQLVSMAVLSFCSETHMSLNCLYTFCNQFMLAAEAVGIQVGSVQPIIRYCNPRLDSVENGFNKTIQRVLETCGEYPKLLFCILPNSKNDLYAHIKYVGDTKFGIATQCILAKNTFPPKHLSSLVLKVNMKLGGSNVLLTQIPFVLDRPTIIFGADITHPPAKDTEKRPSISALVASVDSGFARYSSSVRTQVARQDVIQDLETMVKELLYIYVSKNRLKPERIIFYRDGVATGQHRQVVEAEVAAIKKACSQFGDYYKPTLSFITVQKRHHVRFFPMNREQADGSGNVKAGTVVDSTITHPFEFDFFLNSHSGVQGTSRPAHYRVLYDENEFKANTLQDLTYRLCYLYCRATQAVSVVPPTYYAHMLASRARFHLYHEHKGFAVHDKVGGCSVVPSLNDCMYFV